MNGGVAPAPPSLSLPLRVPKTRLGVGRDDQHGPAGAPPLNAALFPTIRWPPKNVSVRDMDFIWKKGCCDVILL